MPAHVLKPVQQLEWNISSDTARDIESAKQNLDKLVRMTGRGKERGDGERERGRERRGK